ncbi:AAA family ATPase [Actinoplanes sp. NPDC049681]|uniref:AAA family ATPase n=1 Tax=Actinoplanes sp. NPDC049681 TaxID=3363905 RepID=UPI0037B58AD0
MTSNSTAAAPPAASTALFMWNIPSLEPGASVALAAEAGRTTMILGANGSGKSALGLWLDTKATGTKVKRLIAHRKLWFENAGPNITPARRDSAAANIKTWNMQENSRYLDHAADLRSEIVLFDLLSTINYRNSNLAALHDSGASHDEIAMQVEPSPLTLLNGILARSGLDIQLALTATSTFSVVKSNTGPEYPIFMMSDGEKSAVLLAAEVLSAEEGSILIIDEPERHVHRRISASLIAAVIASRPDCSFIVLTHDLELASALPASETQVYVLGTCKWLDTTPIGWSLARADLSETLPEAARREILGGRRQILFVEGERQSLDVSLYRILFPDWTPTPSGSCDHVIRSVTGLTSNENLHWVHAKGIVDGDGRSTDEIRTLANKGILVLPVSEIESLYYGSEAIEAMAEQQSAALGVPKDDMVRKATEDALASVRQSGIPEHLAASIAVKEIGRKVFDGLPDKNGLIGGIDPISVAMPSPYPALLSRINSLLAAGDLDGLVQLAPIRDTPMRGRIARALRYLSVDDYQSAVRTRLESDLQLVQKLRDKVGALPN